MERLGKEVRIHRLETNLWLPQPRDRIFEFFANPINLERLTPDWLSFKILTKLPAELNEGTVLDYRLRIHGLPLKWQSRITDWKPPHSFVDRQIKGPYRLWIHEHTFTEAAGGTSVGDHVQYSVRGGMLVNRLLVAPDLQRIFAYRHRVLQLIFNPDNKMAQTIDSKEPSCEP
jgi:hypothetical protein